MKRFLYIVALACLAGLLVCLPHVIDATRTAMDTIDSARDGDRSAIGDLRDPSSMNGDGGEWLRRAGVFFVGFAVAGFLGRRAR